MIEVPVCYDEDFAPDLETVAQHCGLEPNEVVARHAAARYGVRCVGFTPGFPFLGGLPAKLATPRRKSPRPAVPAGSVGIGGAQTGIYPLRSPGGWNIIGRTPLRLFDVTREPAALLRAGDRVRFVSIGTNNRSSRRPPNERARSGPPATSWARSFARWGARSVRRANCQPARRQPDRDRVTRSHSRRAATPFRRRTQSSLVRRGIRGRNRGNEDQRRTTGDR